MLRQLVAWLGDEAFLAGLRAYFTAHAFGNATLADLLAALSAASGRDLTGWAEVWLRRAQVNTLRPEVSLGPDGRYAAGRRGADRTGRAPDAASASDRHRRATDGRRHRVRRGFEVDLDPAADGGRTVPPELAGSRPGRLLLLNDGDLTYAKIRFDPASRAALAGVLPALADPLARAVVWAAVTWTRHRDAELPAVEFMALADGRAAGRERGGVFEGTLRFARDVVAKKLPAAGRAPGGPGRAGRRLPPGAAQGGAGRQPPARRGPRPGPVRRAGRGRRARRLAHRPGRAAGAHGGSGSTVDGALPVGRHRRGGRSGDRGRVRARSQRTGAQHAARCRAAIPDPAAKARAWSAIVDDDQVSARIVTATAEGFWQPEQDRLTDQYVPRYFAEMPAMAARRPPGTVRAAALFAFPQYAVSAQTVAAATDLLARDDLNPALRRAVVDGTDELRRALAAREIS